MKLESGESAAPPKPPDEIKIDKGIPIPCDGRGLGRKRKYPFDQMEIGDSVLVNPKSRQAAYYYQLKNPDFKFIVRKIGQQIRIWRVAREGR